MLYEWRVYEIVPGKRKDLNDRFANHTTRIFQKHDMNIVGFWEAMVGGYSNTLYYMLAFRDLAHLENSWRNFKADPEWKQVVAESEKGGPLVVKTLSTVLAPTDYSPMK